MSLLLSSDEKKLLAGLAVLHPIDTLLHTGPWLEPQVETYLSLGASRLVIADADEARLEKFNARQDFPTDVEMKHVVLSRDGGECQYYQASLPAESGLVKPERLRTIWQNIATLDEQTVETMTLDTFAQAYDDKTNWLFVNTINSASILAGSPDLLGRLDVVVARTVLDTDPGSDMFELSQPVLNKLMLGHDFRPYHQLLSHHPNLAHVIYVRDWKSVLKKQAVRLGEEHSHKAEQTQAEFETRLADKDAELQSLHEKHSTLSTSGEDTEKRRQISENNLKNLRARYKTMAQSYRDQVNAMAKIKAQLVAAKQALGETSPAETTNTPRKAKRVKGARDDEL